MTDQHPDRVGGKGFAPDTPNTAADDDETSATTTYGSGKEFAWDVDDPETDPRARAKKGSGKRFAWDVQDAEAEDAEAEDDEAAEERTPGSGTQFEPGRHEL